MTTKELILFFFFGFLLSRNKED